jgi:ribosomal protein S18 acetylase RimI-like enzyme
VVDDRIATADELETQLLDSHHDRPAFDCGIESLTNYLHRSARQQMERRTSIAYVLVPLQTPSRIAGYYTLSNTSVLLKDLPQALAKKLPRYPALPATLLGRLAVNTADQGQRLGERLLVDALARSAEVSAQIASIAVIVDALDDRAAKFYQRYGFQPFADSPRRLFFPMKDVKASFDV